MSQEKVQQSKQPSRASSIPSALQSQPSKFLGQTIPKRIRHNEKQSTVQTD